ncbi:MAG: hypothetical protein M0P12_10470 [Paludibacteraceae bacterium]|nr:hypothetical protein [Paludibacteraceae bacterium]
MKNLIFFTSLLLAGSSLLYSCDKDGEKVENEMSTEYPMPTSDFYKLGYGEGENFGKGLLAIKDTVNVAYKSAEKGFPFDSLTFKGMLVPTISACQRSFELYQKNSLDSLKSAADWKTGFIKAGMEKIGINDTAMMNRILKFYSQMDTDSIINSSNIQNAFEIVKIQGGKLPKLTNEKVL